jgi:hypothetical protein
MKQIRVGMGCVVILLLCCVFGQAQQTVATATNVIVPPLVNFNGVLTDGNGMPLAGVVGVTFYLYKEQQGGAPLWMETQNVQPDQTGRYTVLLGSATSQGLPANIFTSGEAHWLGVQVEGQAEQPRALLLSVPYALKAADAQTIGGLPPSAFVLAAPTAGAAARTETAAVSTDAFAPLVSSPVTGTGTVNFMPLWDTTSDIVSSVIFQSGSGATAKIGINNTTPAATLDVKGSAVVRGQVQLPSLGTATASAGSNSGPFSLLASSFNSGTSKAVSQMFQWQAEPTGNDTATPSGTLNLLFGSGAKPTETGLNIASNGQIAFAPGQTFPGTGAGTVTSVGSGAGLTGGPITGSGTLRIAPGGVTNTMLASPSVTITAGTDLTGGGVVALGGSATLSLNTAATDSRYSQLGANNAFTGSQTITASSSSQVLGVTQSGGAGSGIVGNTSSPTGYGVEGKVTATTGTTAGVYGTTASTAGYGVEGYASALSGAGATAGVYGVSSSNSGYGVLGASDYIAVYGNSSNIGVSGTGNSYGVQGLAVFGDGVGGSFLGGPTSSIGGHGVNGGGGNDTTGSGSFAGSGGVFIGGNSTKGFGGDGVIGVAGTGPGLTGFSYNVSGVTGVSLGGGPGVFGADNFPSKTSIQFNGQDVGVWGDGSNLGNTAGVLATGDDTDALYAQNNSATLTTIGAFNSSSSSTALLFSGSTGGTFGTALIGGAGSCGLMAIQIGQLSGMSGCTNYTLAGDSNGKTYINASGSTTASTIAFRINNAGVFGNPSAMFVANNGVVTIGSLDVTKTLTKPAGSFKIDHPLDPANKYLYHSFVESPDMKNIYDGTVTTDDGGLATVSLPDWFEALNRDFRYQLTVIGQFAQAIVASEISNNQFSIRTDKPNVKVSWQVTGIRQDAFANAYRIQVETEKEPADRGHYLHPELFGAPETARISAEAPSPASATPERKPATTLSQRSVIPVIRPGMIPPRPVLPKLPQPVAVPKPKAAPAPK